MAVFISYARKDAALADLLRQDVERAKRDVWVDRELTGGQDWWDTILGQIRGCNVFIFALSPDSLRSKACMAELHYTLALRRPLLPVMVRDVTVQLAPPEIANAQIVDYRERSVDNAFALVNTLAAAPSPPALPQPLPPAPPVPMSYMNTYRERVEADSLTYRDQNALFVELRDHVRDDDGRETALQLLQQLRRRPDIVESVAQQIDALLANPPPVDDPLAAAASTGNGSGTTTPAGWFPDPTGRFEQRYWDGAAWTDHVARGGQQLRDAPGGPTGTTTTAAQADAPDGAGRAGHALGHDDVRAAPSGHRVLRRTGRRHRGRHQPQEAGPPWPGSDPADRRHRVLCDRGHRRDRCRWFVELEQLTTVRLG